MAKFEFKTDENGENNMVHADIVSRTNWDKELTGDEREVCHTQAALFELCQSEYNCDAFDFVTHFMQSDAAADIDQNVEAYYDVNPFEFIHKLSGKIPSRPFMEKKNIAALHWIGYLYRYWACMGISSKDIIEAIPVTDAYEAYYSLHTLDIREAIVLLIERWIK